MVGGGKGSWSMRGLQLGAALGARVTSAPSPDDVAWADAVVLVKRTPRQVVEAVHRRGVPLIWDALDFWRQPAQNSLPQEAAVSQLRHEITAIKPRLVIGATEAMAAAAGGSYLPHHSWQGLSPTPARARVEVVAYQGNDLYPGRWAQWLRHECKVRGWRFVVNPPDLRVVDILVGFRDGCWDGWICREWKSGVKMVNAVAAGRPFISQDSAARREIGPAGTVIESPNELGPALDRWAGYAERAEVVRQCEAAAGAYRVEAVARRFRALLADRGLACAA